MKNYKTYACFNLCVWLMLAGLATLLLACSYYYGNGAKPAAKSCNLSLHNYTLSKPYHVILKTLQNFPAACVQEINKITITNSSALEATAEVLWV